MKALMNGVATRGVLCKKVFLEISGLRSATLLKKRLWYRCFHVNFVKFIRTLFSQSTPGRLLLLHQRCLTGSEIVKDKELFFYRNYLVNLKWRRVLTWNLSNGYYSSYKVKWRIPKLILKAWTISFNVLNYISIF